MHSISLPRPGPGPDVAPGDGGPRAPEVRITLAIGAAVLVQTALALIWTGAASERLAQLEKRADENAELVERTARVEEQVRFATSALARIERKLDHAITEERPR
ncbi:MAG: hypothetical protein AAGA09_02510 [Pseudomonadota bacterium]